MKQPLLFGMALALGGTPAAVIAQPDPDTQPTQAEEVRVEAEKLKKPKKCRYVSATGSRMRQKVCRSAEEAREESQAAREIAEEMRRNGPALQGQEDLGTDSGPNR